MKELKSPKQVREEFTRRGQSITAWAMANDLRPMAVYDLLNGRTQGNRGDAHKAAVLLGIKDGEIVEDEGHKGRRVA